MAALDGAGGGVMGGLMGPMLAVMLLYLPLSLASTALLMLLLQALFSAGAVYLVGAGANAPEVNQGWLGMFGRVLGAGQGITDVVEKHGVPTPVMVAKQPTRRLDRSASKPTLNRGPNWGNRLTIAFVVFRRGGLHRLASRSTCRHSAGCSDGAVFRAGCSSRGAHNQQQ
jgi:hypothetical protein